MEENRNNDMIGTRSYVPRRPAAPIVDTGLGLSPVKPFVPSGAPVPGGVPVKENVKTDNPVKHFVPPVPPTAPVAKGGTVTENAKPVASATASAGPVASPAPKTENGSAGVGGAGKNVTTAGTVPAAKTEKTDVQVAKPKTPDAGTVPVKKEDAATETKDADEKMSKAEKAALRFIQNKKSLQQKKDALERGMKELEAKKKQLRQEKKEAEAKLKKFDKQEEIILGLAAIPTAAEDRPNRIKAIDSYFNLLNLFNKSDASGEKKFSELYNAVHPVTLLFGYVAEAAKYDAERKQVVIDEALLFRRVRDRLTEQERLKAEAEETLKAMANK